MEIQKTMPVDLPVLAVCGFSGSGKTTLVEALLPQLNALGWRVAVIKHDAHGLQIDRPGKDSDRLFQAGADVIVHGPNEFLLRGHKTNRFDLGQVLAECRYHYDLILIEGHKDTPFAKVWLDSEGEPAIDPPVGVVNIVLRLTRNENRVAALLSLLQQWLPALWKKKPVHACILIGGMSRRMGQPKHLLLGDDGLTWIERQVSLLKGQVQRVVVAGAGGLPAALSGVERLVDVPDIHGPMAGMLAAMRWQPDVSWLMVACDMPAIRPEAIEWLLHQRGPGHDAVQPCLNDDGSVEPLLACYEPRSRAVMEQMVRKKEYSPSRLRDYCSVGHPVVPEDLRLCWANVNSAMDLPTR